MKTSKTRKGRSAFTLIELLVVIAIIGILAGLLFPVIGGVMISATATKVGTNGRSIVYGIIQANTEREALSLGDIWPSAATTFTGGDSPKTYSGVTSNEYFYDLIYNEVVENLTLALFAGGGVATASKLDDFKIGVNFNVWSAMCLFPSSAPDDMPFIYTRNTDIIGNKNLSDGTTIEITKDNRLKFLDKGVKPFENVLTVIVQKGGGVQTIKQKNIVRPDLIYGSANFTAELSNVEAMPAVGATSGGIGGGGGSGG